MSLFGKPPGGPQPNSLFNVLAQDPGDQTRNYNTPLAPKQESNFLYWLLTNRRGGDLYDYDMRGAYKGDAQAAGNGHLPDTWKKPNHPTFSRESIYSGPYAEGGEWAPGPNDSWSFDASPANLLYRSPEELQGYFNRVEPNSVLRLPQKRK